MVRAKHATPGIVKFPTSNTPREIIMKRFPASCIVLSVVWLLTSSDSAFAAEGPAAEAPTPPMGWNSFDSYGVYLHEEAALANIDAMAEKLKPHGYEFFVVDNGWFGEYQLQEGTMFPAEKHASGLAIE